nr:MAG TPA: hypothetical protein [Caudoviricetes sp.]
MTLSRAFCNESIAFPIFSIRLSAFRISAISVAIKNEFLNILSCLLAASARLFLYKQLGS